MTNPCKTDGRNFRDRYKLLIYKLVLSDSAGFITFGGQEDYGELADLCSDLNSETESNKEELSEVFT